MEKITLTFSFYTLIINFLYCLRISASVQPEVNNLDYIENAFLNNTFYNTQFVTSGPVTEYAEDKDMVKAHKRREVFEHKLSQKLKLRILELHNIYRSNVTPPAGNMAFMEWDEDLEHLAQLWANVCSFEHGKPENTAYPGIYGQNLYIGTDETGLRGVWMWYDEYRNYFLHNKTCKEGAICGHYVTMAWAESNKLGCAMARCDYRYYLVCHYSPGALRGLPIYDVSRPCTQCPPNSGMKCYKNLCFSKEQCERNPKKCELARCNVKCKNCGRINEEDCHCECADGWDSFDCSRLCTDSHDKCGKKPGFPNKATCSLNKYAVANVYCRRMCERCNPVMDDEITNHVCCDRKLCPNGYVLDTESCTCSILCPGPTCDDLDGSGVIVSNSVALIVVTIFLLYMNQKIL